MLFRFRVVVRSFQMAVIVLLPPALLVPDLARATPTSPTESEIAYEFPLARTSWIPASLPSGKGATLADHASLEWYQPPPGHVLRHDLNPLLRDDEGGKVEEPALELRLLPANGDTTLDPSQWVGITQALSPTGYDFTAAPFLEIWVNDFRADHGATVAALHVDLGRVSEDAFWDKHAPPNGRLDSEDLNGDGLLEYDEDTGLDGVPDEQEPGYDPTSNKDPNGDDYYYVQGSGDYSGINNTERNGLGIPNARPDTEDLNRNGILDLTNNYFEVTVDLSQERWVAVDVPNQYSDQPVVRYNAFGNGWRLFRIPLGDSTVTRVGSPSWDNVQSARIWFDGMTAPLTLQLAGIALGDSSGSTTPAVVVLRQNVPNPFNPTTTIPYVLPATSRVRVAVFDVRGRLVRRLFDREEPAGSHAVAWDGRDTGGVAVPSGIYFCRLEALGRSFTMKMVLAK